MVCSFNRCVICLIAYSVLSASDSLAQGDKPAVSTDAIRAAWKKRAESIQSFQYNFVLTELKDEPPPDAKDLFGTNTDGILRPGARQSTGMFRREGDKLAYMMEGGRLAEGGKLVEKSLFQVVYANAIQKRFLHTDGFTPKGNIEKGESDHLTAGYHLMAIWLASDPEPYLKRQIHPAEEMKVVSTKETRDGRECVKVELPAKFEPPAGMEASLKKRLLEGVAKSLPDQAYFDPARGFVPVQFLQIRQGKLAGQLDITYAENPACGWVVSGWKYVRYNANGSFAESSIANVTECNVNKPANEPFDIQFPAGTQVVDYSGRGRKIYQLMPDGTQKAMTADEYSRQVK